MIFATVTGRITKDATLRQAGAESVCAISIASNKKAKGENVATFVDASLWGKRGEAIVQYLRKGTAVTVVGELSTREHNGKTYPSLRVNEIDFQGGGEKREKPPEPKSSGGGYDDEPFNRPDPGDDQIPFATNVTNEPAERWWKRT
jgi:single-strand DNA-binding protein